jgi:hypothetical protein
MSQVVKAIVESDTGNRAVIEDKFSPLFQDVFNAKSEIFTTRDDYHQVVKVYRIGVTIGSQAMVNEIDTIDNPESLPSAIDRVKRQVIEAIFGEFRQDFMQVERALYDRDFQKARDYLRVFEDKMYSTK